MTWMCFAQLAAQGAMIDRLSSDSRRCAPGVAFLAYPGEARDGRAPIADAVARGAAASSGRRRASTGAPNGACPISPSRAEAAGERACARVLRPSLGALWVCGVTGTNGKTSCSQWIAALLDKTAVIGTLGAGFPGALSAATNTTPDAVETQFLLKNFSTRAKAVAMEVSSHGWCKAA